jgi:glycosyltransferase involved in cell wall biosynthesis
MKSKPLVSVIINNYNKKNYCVEALKSAIKQSYKKIEVIFFDDNSSDSSVKKIYKFKNEFKIKNLKVIINKRRGNIFSFNQMEGIRKSLKKSKGQIVCLMDSDDFFKKNKVKNIVEYFKKNEFKDILFDRPIIYYDSKKEKKSSENYIFRQYKWPKFPPTSCISFRKKSLINNLNKINIKRYEELWFDFRIATYFAIKKKQFNILNKHLTYYRQNIYSFDKKYKKYFNLVWWKRRKQAFRYLNFLDKNSYKKNIYSFDLIITKIINRINSLKNII